MTRPECSCGACRVCVMWCVTNRLPVPPVPAVQWSKKAKPKPAPVEAEEPATEPENLFTEIPE